MQSLVDCLHEWGVRLTEAELVALLRETLSQIAGGDLRVEPEAELPAEELNLLRDGGFSVEREYLASDDPLFRAALDLSALIATALTTRDAAALLGVDPSRIRQRLAGLRPTLYGIKWRGEWLLPRFQFAGQMEVPGLAEVIPHLDASLSPIAVARWFLTPSPDLVIEEDDAERNLSPRAWLLAGHSHVEVARLAQGL